MNDLMIMYGSELSQWWEFNKPSIVLGCAMALATGPLFAISHELTKAFIGWIKNKRGHEVA